MMGAEERKGTEKGAAGVDEMDVKKISEKGSITKILVKGVDAALMNSVRRTIMNNTPVIAIEDVYIYDNNSVMFDEFLAHRLALIPVKSDPKSYKTGEKVKMILDKEGPCTVYSKDIQSTDPAIEVIDKNYITEGDLREKISGDIKRWKEIGYESIPVDGGDFPQEPQAPQEPSEVSVFPKEFLGRLEELGGPGSFFPGEVRGGRCGGCDLIIRK